MAPDLRTVAHRLNGEVSSGQVLFPAPGPSPRDRSACLRFDREAPDGFVIHSFAGDDPLPIRDFVRERLRLPLNSRETTRQRSPFEFGEVPEDTARTAQALTIWSEARNPHGTPVETYLWNRGLELPEEAAGEVIRFHRACPFGKGHKGMAMVCLVRNINTDEPQGIHRTAVSREGLKSEIEGKSRMALGPMAGGAIKLTPDENVTLCLGIGEGIERALSLRRRPDFGSSPVWSLISASGVQDFPILSGIESLFIAVDHDPAGQMATRRVAHRWHGAGQEVFLVTPIAPYADLNDLDRER